MRTVSRMTIRLRRQVGVDRRLSRVVAHGSPQLIAVGGNRGCDVVRLPRMPSFVLGSGRLDRTYLLSWPRPGRTSTGRLCHLRPLRHHTASRDWRLTIAVTQSPRAATRLRRAAILLLAVVGVVLVVRGLALEILLATNTAGLRANVGPPRDPLEPHPLEPVFALGGALFPATAIRAIRSGFMRIPSQ